MYSRYLINFQPKMESSNKSKSGNFSRNANAFILISSFLVFFPSLNGDFVFDDLPAIVKNPDLSDHSKLFDVLSNVFRHDFWGENLTSSHSHKSFRPLTTLTFWIQGKISRQNVFQFHFVNVLLHTVNCFLAFKIYRENIYFLRKLSVYINFSICILESY